MLRVGIIGFGFMGRMHYFPLGWDVQPFWYQRQGFPTILEIPLQGWINAQWRREHGWSNWPAYHDYLKTRVDELAENGMFCSHCQHDWTSILYDEQLKPGDGSAACWESTRKVPTWCSASTAMRTWSIWK